MDNNIFDYEQIFLKPDRHLDGFLDIEHAGRYVECVRRAKGPRSKSYYFYLGIAKLLVMRNVDVVYVSNWYTNIAIPIKEGVNEALDNIYAFNRF